MKKLNIAELLKDCPKGMELDCTMYDDVSFEGIKDVGYINILIKTPNGTIELSKNGCYHIHPKAKCVIFPKGKTTWEGFQRPFKDGDIVVAKDDISLQIFILKGVKSYEKDGYSGYCYFGWDFDDNVLYHEEIWEFNRLATEEEKQKLFDAIKENGYKWNPETKTLEKLIEPKFKVGDRITNGKVSITIGYIDDNYYYEVGRNIATRVLIKTQDDWKLVPNKFDITTLKPFDKVLVRNYNSEKWTANLFGFFGKNMVYPYSCIGNCVHQCVPYENNEHLLGTTNDCDDYYKTWQ